jgi:hypothetical protein
MASSCATALSAIVLTAWSPAFGQFLDRGAATASADDVVGEALGVGRIVGEKVEPFRLHGATSPAVDTSNLQLQINAMIAR